QKAETTTTVKAELRRLMLEEVHTTPGKFATRTFTVNVRVPQIATGGAVKLKDREKTSELWAWDEKLTLEFNNRRPSVCAIEMEKGEGVGAFTTYKASLKRFVEEARKRGGIPVLITPMHRRTFDAQGRIINSHGNYPEAVRQAAKEENVALIDLNEMSRPLYEAWG